MLRVSLREAKPRALVTRCCAFRYAHAQSARYARIALRAFFAGGLRPPTPPMRKTHFAYGSLVLRFAVITKSPSFVRGHAAK